MTYLAITQGTAEWLLAKGGVVDSLHETLLRSSGDFRLLQTAEFAAGPIRMAASEKREVIALWNTDYLTGTGEEAWGFILIDSDGGLLGNVDISREVIERCLYVINQRLQRFMIDGAYIHRSHDNGAHTLLAGRGTAARRYSLGYWEAVVEPNEARRNAILCVGPVNDPTFVRHIQRTAKEGIKLPGLVTTANAIISETPGRPSVGSDAFATLRASLIPFVSAQGENPNEYSTVQVAADAHLLAKDAYRAQGLSYRDWTRPGGLLTDVQRRILASDALDRHPLRIVGPGGSGKTLLMQLLAIKVLLQCQTKGQSCRILYAVHNEAMREKVQQRFDVLLTGTQIAENQQIDVTTLAEYGRSQLGIDFTSVIDSDAQHAKEFQFDEVGKALVHALEEKSPIVSRSSLLREIAKNTELQQVFSAMIMAEISIAIKGRGLATERRRYIEAQTALSRLHGVLNLQEREFVFDVFEEYHRAVFEHYQVLDTDDIALSLLGKLRTPLWELKRRTLGYDYVLIDETQLFNENERRILPLLTKGTTSHVPVALALDEAQQLYGQSSAGLATLGIKDITNESLPSIHRSTRSIVRLAFFVVQRCTDLFSADFPDFTSIADDMVPDTHPLAATPRFELPKTSRSGLAKLVTERVRLLRASNIRQIVVICHAEQYWAPVYRGLANEQLPLYVLEQRGQKLPLEQPMVVLTRPAHVGGQEFDAAIIVGLEQGVVPPRVIGNDALASAIEQQAMRETYLAVTRARFQVIFAMSHRAMPNALLKEAARAGLIESA